MEPFFSASFGNMLIRFAICILFNWIIIDRLYFKKSKRRDFYFTFMLISIAIFFLVFFMIFVLDDMKGKTSMGIGIGLFGIFSIMRYRTDAMPVREMTYLFVLICLSVVNALAANIPLAELLCTNILIALAVYVCELHLKVPATKLIQYDRIELIKPEVRDELKADLEARTGLKITKIDVGGIDMLKDSAVLRITYETNEKNNSSINDQFTVTKSQWRTDI